MNDQVRNILMGLPKKALTGGPPGHLPHLVKGLEELGVNVHQVLYGSRRNQQTLIGRIKDWRAAIVELRAVLKHQEVDLVHLNSGFDIKALLRDISTLFFLSSYAKPVFLKYHGSDARLLETSNPILRLLSHALFRRVVGIGLLSTEERENFKRAGVPETKLHIVKNILDAGALADVAGGSGTHGAPANVPILLFIARFIREKGLFDVIQAVKILTDQKIDIELVCVGDGPIRHECETEVRALGLSERVRFVGFVPEEQSKKYYAGSTMLVFPTYHQEGFPMVVFYSVAAGLPVITTRIRAAADYLKEPENCLWVEPRNPLMLAERIRYLLERPELRKSMKDNNRALARQFNRHVVASEFLKVYFRCDIASKAREGVA